MGPPPGCNGNGICDPGESSGSCPSDCGGGTPSCDNDGQCEAGEDANTCAADCPWWLPDVATPPTVDPATLPAILGPFPAPDEAMCELPERCQGPVTAFVDPWTGAHATDKLERSRLEITQVKARGQRAWTYFSLMALEGDSVDVYGSVLADAMRFDLDGSTYPLEPGTLQVHPARPAMWDYLQAAGEARVSVAGYEGIDIDGGFYDTACFDPDNVAGFGAWLLANTTAGERAAMEAELVARGFPAVTLDASFDYAAHLRDDRGFTSAGDFGGEGRLLRIDFEWDRYINAGVFERLDGYIAAIHGAGTQANGAAAPVFLNRAEGDSLWTTADRLDVIGGETFINDGDILYPVQRRMAPYFRQGSVVQKRVWSWNFPRVLDPGVAERVMDTALIYIAENDAAGGLLQIPDRSIKYPLCPESEPLCDATDAEMDALWAKILPYLDHREAIRETLHHPLPASVLVLELLGVPNQLWDNEARDLGFAGMGIGALLGELQVHYDVTGWADGDVLHRLARTPWVDDALLASYDWVVLAEPHLLSDAQIAALDLYMADGGKVIALLWGDRTCEGADVGACELKSGCRFDAQQALCEHVVDRFTAAEGSELYVVEDVNVMQARDDAAVRAAAVSTLTAALGGDALPRELAAAVPLTDLGVFHGRRAGDGAHIWQLVNYAWDEATYSGIPRAATPVELTVPAELQGRSVNVTWFAAPGERVELLSGVTPGPTLALTLPAFAVWGTLVMTEGAHEPFAAHRPRPPYVKISSYQPGGAGPWQFKLEATSSHAALTSGYVWARELVEVAPQQWEVAGDWHAIAEVDFSAGGSVDPGRKATAIVSWTRPSSLRRLEFYATACDAEGLCQPFVPWPVLVRPPSP
jgi:hypothetical protein